MKPAVWDRLLSPATLKALTIAIGAVAVASLMGGKLYTISGDLAFHYDLTRALQTVWLWPTTQPPITSGMEGYPPLAHYAAAVAGLPWRSPLVGLNIAAILAVFGCYLILAETVTAGSLIGSGVSLAIAAGVLALGRTQYAIIGYEVFYSFFFAQMVGECVFLAFVLWLCRTHRGWRTRLVVAAGAAFFGDWLYPLSALQMALAYMGLEAILVLRAVRASRTVSLGQIVPLALGVLLLPPLVAANPVFWAMVHVSYNDGGLGLLALERLVPELAALLLVLGIGLGVFGAASERWRKGTLALAVAGVATATGALAQSAALELIHAGSPYAVKKYGFAVVTLLAFSLGALAATWLEKRGARRSWTAAGVLAPVIFAAGATLLAPNHAPQPLRPFLKYQKAIGRILRDPGFPAGAWSHTVSHQQRFGWMLNHLVTMGDLKMPLHPSLAAARSDLDPAKPAVADYAFMADPKGAYSPRCTRRFAADPAIAFVDLGCDRKHLALPMKAPGELMLSALDALPRPFTKGWSGKDPAGVWTDGPMAEVTLHFDDPPRLIDLSLNLTAFLPKPGSVQRVNVGVGGQRLTTWTFDAKSPGGWRDVQVPRGLLRDGDLTLDLDLPDAVSPARLGVSADPRQLAVFLAGFSASNGAGLSPGETVDLARSPYLPKYFLSGWSGLEPTGVWSEGSHAVIEAALERVSGPVTLAFTGQAFLPNPRSVQHVNVAVGGRRLATWTFDASSGAGQRTVTVPAALIRDGRVKLDLDLPDATSPAAQRLSADTRVLAYFVKSFSVVK